MNDLFPHLPGTIVHRLRLTMKSTPPMQLLRILSCKPMGKVLNLMFKFSNFFLNMRLERVRDASHIANGVGFYGGLSISISKLVCFICIHKMSILRIMERI